ALPEFLAKQRWFGGKSRRIRQARVADWTAARPQTALALIDVEYDHGAPETYFLPLAISHNKAADQIRENAPASIIANAITPEGRGILNDAVFDDESCAAFLSLIENSAELETRRGRIRGKFNGGIAANGSADQVKRTSAEQSNSSVLYGDRLILKLFRRYQPGPNPDCEVEKYLTESAHF